MHIHINDNDATIVNFVGSTYVFMASGFLKKGDVVKQTGGKFTAYKLRWLSTCYITPYKLNLFEELPVFNLYDMLVSDLYVAFRLIRAPLEASVVFT